MKRITSVRRSKFNLPGFVVMLAAIVTFSSCSSEYHWVKVKSADPHFASKSDNYAKTGRASIVAPAPAVASSMEQPSASLATASTSYSYADNSVAATTQDYAASLATATSPENAASTLDKAQTRAEEIRASLSPERKAALSSTDKNIRKQAITETIHEQLAKDVNFNQLPEGKKALLEKILVNRTSHLASVKAGGAASPMRKNTAGFNTLLLVGLILLLVGLIFDFIPGIGIVGVIFTIIGLVLAILGLVQMLA